MEAATVQPAAKRSAGRRLADRLHGHRRLQLGLLLSGPLGWLGLAYLGSLAVLFVAAFWRLDPFTSQVVHEYGTQNFDTIINGETYRRIAVRTFTIAALVTVADVVLAFPIAFFMAKVARPRMKGVFVVAVLMPLWSSYLVKVYAWRTILSTEG